MKAWDKCEHCPDEICMNCSILTLDLVLSGSNRRIELLTPKGRKLVLSEGGED